MEGQFLIRSVLIARKITLTFGFMMPDKNDIFEKKTFLPAV